MQTANIMVHIAGDSGTIVPKYQVTAAEIAVLRAIHGADAVTDVEPAEDIERSDRDEIRRLHEIYSRPGEREGPVFTLYPGAAARAYRTLDELEIPEEFYKAEARVKPKPAEKADEPAKPEKHAKGKGKAKHEPEPEHDVEAELAAEDKLFD